MHVDLVDPNTSARDQAVALLTSAARGLTCEPHESIANLHIEPDIAIIATNARERADAITQIVNIGGKNLIIEKFLFTRRDEYLRIQDLLQTSQVKSWVNCVRRSPDRFHRILELIAGRAFNYRVEGHGWGLASNVIHHLDEWMYLTGTYHTPAITHHLMPSCIPAKRPGYFEILGEIFATAKTSCFTAVCKPATEGMVAGDRLVTIDCGDTILQIGQTTQSLRIFSYGRLLLEEPYPLPLQSEATAWHVATILAGGQPPLPTYDQATTLHLALFDALLPHFMLYDPSLKECPIT